MRQTGGGSRVGGVGGTTNFFFLFCERQAPDGACREPNFGEYEHFESISGVFSVCLPVFKNILKIIKTGRGSGRGGSPYPSRRGGFEGGAAPPDGSNIYLNV